MKRDMDLIREILLKVYEHEEEALPDITIENRSTEEVMAHVKLARDAGLIEAFDASSASGRKYISLSLTWDGQDFIEAAKNDNLWNKAKGIILDKASELTIETLKITLKTLIVNSLTGHNP